MTELDDRQLAGPRLAVRVAELIALAARDSTLSQREIAEKMGISESRLSQIINGDGNFHTATLGRYFAAVGCSLDLKIFRADGHEVAIPRRGDRRRKQAEAIYVHPVETEAGTVTTVISYAHNAVPGRAVDYPIRAESAAQARRLANEDDLGSLFEFKVDLERANA